MSIVTYKKTTLVKNPVTKNSYKVKKIHKLSFMAAFLLLTAVSCKEKSSDMEGNPFFNDYQTPFNVPPFDKIKAEHYLPAFEKAMAEGRAEIEKIIKNKAEPDFANTIEAFDNSGELLRKVSAVFFAQAEANTSDSLQVIEMEISPRLAAYQDEIRLNQGLFEKIKHVYEHQSDYSLNEEQAFILENLYKGFVRNGANLNASDQDTLKIINQELSVLTVQYDQNVLAETNNYRLIVSEEGTDGLPKSVADAAAEAASAAGDPGKWVFTTQRPSIFPFLTYSPDRKLRRQIFNAYTNRGNNGNEFDNKEILKKIIQLRAKRARLLGYRNHADIVLEPRMAKEPENVFTLLNSLWERALPVAKKEAAEMQKLIDREKGGFRLEPHDWWYYAEKLRKEKYDLNDEELRPYFMLDNVIDGVFTLATRLFGITISPLPDCPVPHPDARAYAVKEADGTHIGVLYIDVFPRESKRQGAWCITYRNHKMSEGVSVTPVVTVVCNFTRPAGNLPSLLSIEEVATLFHEFGHALDALFNRNSYNLTYPAWDFVELPSQLMEHWVTEPEMLKLYAHHYLTGETIPESLVTKLRNSSYFNQGFENVEVYAASFLDMAYHTLEAPVNIDIEDFEKAYMSKLGLIPEIVPRYRSTYFTHITGEYDAGYYSYTWASVIDNDAYEAFRENGIFDRSTAEKYRRMILEKNGIMDAMESYIDFRGHEPKIEALLKNKGLLE
jgi:peptidyl-dipeptidase Dcp